MGCNPYPTAIHECYCHIVSQLTFQLAYASMTLPILLEYVEICYVAGANEETITLYFVSTWRHRAE